MNWYKISAKNVCEELGVDSDVGLDAKEASVRLETNGSNILASRKKETILDLFLRQFKSPLIYILIIASLVVLFLGQIVDALVILAVLIINSIIGTFQEGRAVNSLERLKSLVRHRALVLRGGEEMLISAEELVVGDILILKEGDRIGADARIIHADGLRVDEAVLTGEAYAVSKTDLKIDRENLVVGDFKNMVFSGTSVVAGGGQAVVVAIGFDSEIGKISQELLETSTVPLPLFLKIRKITRFIAGAVFVVSVLIFAIGMVRGLAFLEIFPAVVGLAVSMIPEGLPVAVTIVLSSGVWRMARQKAIVRQMAAVEAMGNADMLLVDKTGTLTTGKMEVSQIFGGGRKINVERTGYKPIGKIEVAKNSDFHKLLELVALSLSADVVDEQGHGWKPVGDPTEASIAVVCHKAGLVREKLQRKYKKVFVKPFDSEKRYIEAEFNEGKKSWHVFIGAPDHISHDLGIDHSFARDAESITTEGKRVVGAVILDGNRLKATAIFAIDEEVREEVSQSIAEAKVAGFGVAMLTGDYPNTARAIAKKVGIFGEGDGVLTGAEIEKLSEGELAQKVNNTTVFCRITPTHKLLIVRAFQKNGHVCAMTGDGVNDGPALQAADLGIGLGSGTQVARDASDIVLTDDNFETIVSAISFGRAIYLTLKKVILYLFSTSLGEVLTIGFAIFLGLPLPVVAVQIIWLNFVTDGFFVAALAADPIHRNLATLRDRGSNLIDRLMVVRMFTMGFSMFLVSLPVFYFYSQKGDLTYARTMVLLVLSAVQWLNALNVRSRFKSVFITPLDNKFLIASFAAVFVLQILVIQTPFGNSIMHTAPLSLSDWIVALGLSTSVIWVEELRKFITSESPRVLNPWIKRIRERGRENHGL